MPFVDVLAIVLVLGAAAAFARAEVALSGAQDLPAIYWLIVGVAALRAAGRVAWASGARPGAGR